MAIDYYKAYVVKCDGCNVRMELSPLQADDAVTAWDAARAEGWKLREGKDLCEKCANDAAGGDDET